ncbi:MAG: YdcF family protein [Opitutae bacterium]|nr:YdcF family protein [Opitutae bacterium]
MTHAATGIVVLGAPNDPQGRLSSLALERCAQAFHEWTLRPGAKLLPTGGWGAHFNTTPLPHHHYLRAQLIALGVPAEAFVEGVESANTIEDAQRCRPIVARHGFSRLVVVTSDFHVARAQFLFAREFPELPLELVGAVTQLPAEELQQRIAHEARALAKLRSA